jgi:hypothetical protein
MSFQGFSHFSHPINTIQTTNKINPRTFLEQLFVFGINEVWGFTKNISYLTSYTFSRLFCY